MQPLAKTFSRLKGEEQEQPEPLASSLCPNFTRVQRLYGFVICLSLGLGMSFGGYVALVTGNIPGFAVLYTFGNLISLFGSMCIVGPMSQIKNMGEKNRRLASLLYICSMISTLLVAFLTGHPILCILLMIVQWCALSWYILSYIPYGRKMVITCLDSFLG
eukprot:c11245_g1_i1.p1 GENE.c11245_g1_i1~~c11245_g1_i1.p1  ORF type:complete len:161 (-),score=35.40 c11245_g1_i1:81-563(-)